LIAELRARHSDLPNDTDREAVAAVANLDERCATGVHLYGWFIGD
jgi:hypothetical protein